jgi:hypothetical protein
VVDWSVAMKPIRWIVPLVPGTAALVAAALLAACMSPSPRERDAARLAQFESVAEAPVDSFRFWTLHKWESLGPEAIAVWTRLNEAYLLRVDKPCVGLEYARAIGLSSSANTVNRRFDTVNFGDQRCRIAEIRPVDAKAVKRRPAPQS